MPDEESIPDVDKYTDGTSIRRKDLSSDVKTAKQRQIVERLGWGDALHEILKDIDVTLLQYATWMKGGRTGSSHFKGAIEEVLEAQSMLVEDSIFRSAIRGNAVAQIFWTTNKLSDTWKDRRGLGGGGAPGYVKIEVYGSIPRPRGVISAQAKANPPALPMADPVPLE